MYNTINTTMGRHFYIEQYIHTKDIAIYGASITGRKIYEQLLQEKDIRIVAVIDRNADTIKSDYHCPLLTFQELEESSLHYDYIILASSSINTKNIIYNTLCENGVASEKIISLEECLSDGKYIYLMKDNPDEFMKQLILCNAKCYESSTFAKEADMWFKMYLDRITDKEYLIKYARAGLFDSLNTLENAILCGLLLFLLKDMYEDDTRQFVKLVAKLPENKYNIAYHLSKEISLMELYFKNVLYREMGLDRKRINKKIAEYYSPALFKSEKKCKVTDDKITILAICLFDKSHSASILYRYIANALCDNGKQVQIIIPIYLPTDGLPLFSSINNDWADKNSDYQELNRKLINSNVEIHYIVEDTISMLFQRIITQIDDFAPACVIDALDEYSPVSALIIKKYPIYCFAIRTCTTGSFFTRTNMVLFEYNQEIANKILPLPKPLITLESVNCYTRQQKLGISDNSFVVITVGERLFSEISKELVNEMSCMLARNNDMHWVLVGDTRMEYIFRDFCKVTSISTQIHILPYEKDLPALYRICDVYLNPDRQGGGFSIMFAMEQGLAIAAIKGNTRNAAENWIGRSEMIQGNYKELCLYIESLLHNKDLLKKQKTKMRNLYETYADRKKWGEYLCDAITQTIDAYYSESEDK